MNDTEKQYIHTLFENKDYLTLYQVQPEAVNEMLGIESRMELEDFLEDDWSLDERVFMLFYSAVHGERLIIGGYEEDVTEKVTAFLLEKLPEIDFSSVKDFLQNIYVDIDERDNLQEKIGLCNQRLKNAGYHIQLEYDDTYCVLVYFLSVQHISE